MADKMIVSIGAPAVPQLVARLRSLHTSALRINLIRLRQKLGLKDDQVPDYLGLPADVSGDAALINHLLAEMGEAARPAVPAMLDSVCDMHVWACDELMKDFVRMGPAASAALPKLKEWAQAGDTDAAQAVTLLESGTREWSPLNPHIEEIPR